MFDEVKIILSCWNYKLFLKVYKNRNSIKYQLYKTSTKDSVIKVQIRSGQLKTTLFQILLGDMNWLHSMIRLTMPS